MYMKQYTIAEFRQKTRQVFNEAENEPITITRYGEEFYLFKANNMVIPQKALAPVAPARSGKLTSVNVSQKYEGKGKNERLEIHDENPTAPESASPVIKTTEEAQEVVRGIQAKKMHVDESRDFDFCKHGAVKGLCKKGCK
jgi:hypothetical protein